MVCYLTFFDPALPKSGPDKVAMLTDWVFKVLASVDQYFRRSRGASMPPHHIQVVAAKAVVTWVSTKALAAFTDEVSQAESLIRTDGTSLTPDRLGVLEIADQAPLVVSSCSCIACHIFIIRHTM